MDAERMQMIARVQYLERVLERIIDEPLVVKTLLFRDPEAWTEAVSALSNPSRVAED